MRFRFKFKKTPGWAFEPQSYFNFNLNLSTDLPLGGVGGNDKMMTGKGLERRE